MKLVFAHEPLTRWTSRDILHQQPFNLLWTCHLESRGGFTKPSEVVFKEASPLEGRWHYYCMFHAGKKGPYPILLETSQVCTIQRRHYALPISALARVVRKRLIVKLVMASLRVKQMVSMDTKPELWFKPCSDHGLTGKF